MRHLFVTYVPRTFPYLRPYRLLLGAAAVLSALAVVVGLAAPWPLALLVDSALGSKPPPEWLARVIGLLPSRLILTAVLAGLIITFVSSLLDMLNSYCQTRLEQRMILDFRSDLFGHIQRLSLAFHDEQRKGMLMFAVNYQAAAVGEITTSLLPLAESVLTVVGMFVVTYRIHPVLALLSLVVVPFIYISTGLYGRYVEPRLRNVRGLEGTSLSIVHEAVSMMRVIVAFGRERHEHGRFRRQGRQAVDARVNITVLQTAFSLGVSLITAAGTALVIGYGAQLVLRRQLSVGELLVVLAYIAAVYRPLEQISGTMAAMQERLISLEAAVELLDTQPDVADPPDGKVIERAAGAITFADVSFSYPGRSDTLKHISFAVAPGQRIGIVGPTGAGKSTLVSLIPRFIDPLAGQVLLDGVDVRAIRLESLRKQVSLVLQDSLLFSGTIMGNIRYGRLDATDEEVIAAAKDANAHEFISALPQGYQTRLGEGGAKLSGGERQRIAIARAFLKDAPILILDEPTSAIDTRTESVILEALTRLMQGRTTIMIAHRLSTIRDADQILVLHHGELVEHGTHDELIGSGGFYTEMVEAQSGHRPAVPAAAQAVPALGQAGGAAEGVSLIVPELSEARREEQGDRQGGAPRHRSGPPDRHPAPAAAARQTPATPSRPKVVVLGMLTKMPVAGVVWQTLHYLIGLQRCGMDPYYVEAHARTPSMLMEREDDDSSARAAAFIHGALEPHGLGHSWAYHALHDDGRVLGMSAEALRALYRDAALIINLHGGTLPRPEHSETGRLVYLETDPVQLQIELYDQRQETIDFLEPHVAFFTFGENLGHPDCGLPVPERFRFQPTRQPVLLDHWASRGRPPGDVFTTIGNWEQPWREVIFRGETYTWSKDVEFRKVLDLPGRTGQPLEMALSSLPDADRDLLLARGWRVRPGLEISTDPERYRDYIQSSAGEFTVAKDQNVRLRSGWFSDRSATYLAAGRPVVTQETGFSNILPTGEGLFAFTDVEEAAEALDRIRRDPGRHAEAARAIAVEFFAAKGVLRSLLERCGVSLPTPAAAPTGSTAASQPAAAPGASSAPAPTDAPQPAPVTERGDAGALPARASSPPAAPVPAPGGEIVLPEAAPRVPALRAVTGTPLLPDDAVLDPVSRRPLVLADDTVAAVRARPLPEGPAVPAGGRRRVTTSVVVVNYNGLICARLCLESILAHSPTGGLEVVVVDNASTDGTREYVEALAARDQRVRVLANDDNRGFPAAANQGLEAARGDLLVLCNHDIIVPPGWLSRLLVHLGDIRVGMVGPVTNAAANLARVPTTYRTWGEYLAAAQQRAREHAGQSITADMLQMFCVALRRGVYRRIGPLDESFALGMFEDDDYAERLRAGGLSLVCAEDVLVHHFGEAAFGGLVADGRHASLFRVNRERFERKWGRPWLPHSGRQDPEYQALVRRLRATIRRVAAPHARVLVISRGDHELVDVPDRRTEHFPQGPTGQWSGHHPGADEEAIAHLEELRSAGARYLVVPATSGWWMDFYADFAAHLDNRYERVASSPDGVVWSLRAKRRTRPSQRRERRSLRRI